jgi:bifunctional enzyme CysN/CysC
VKGILKAGKEAEEAFAGEAVTLLLDREIDISRGSVIYGGDNEGRIQSSNIFNVELLWMDDNEMRTGSGYLLKCGTKTAPASIMKTRHKVDINSGKHVAADYVEKNDLVSCEIGSGEKVVYAPFKENRRLGSFILIDRLSNMTSACGVIRFGLRRGENLVWRDSEVTREARWRLMGQEGKTVWFTGLSGSGKTTLANAVEKRLAGEGLHTMLLDGDNVRLGLNRDLGFGRQDRVENIRRVAEVSKLMNDAGLIVLTAFISPFREDRERAREIIGEGNFVEVYVSTPLEVCEGRDVKGLYRKARSGDLPDFTGIDGAYEAPEGAACEIDTGKVGIEEAVGMIIAAMGGGGGG